MSGGILDMAAGVLHVLANASDGAATGASESEDGAGQEQEGETLIRCFHGGDIEGCVVVNIITLEQPWYAGYGV